MFTIVLVAIILGILLSVLITRQKSPGRPTLVPPEDDYDQASQAEKNIPLTFDSLYRLAERLCEENKLTIKDKMINSEQEVYWIAESKNEFFFGTYVLCFFLTENDHPFVPLSELLEFKDFIKSLGSTKGLFLRMAILRATSTSLLKARKSRFTIDPRYWPS